MLKSDIPIPAPQQTNAYSVLDQQAREAAHVHASIHFQARPGVAHPALLSQQIQEYQTVLHKAYIQFTQAPKQEIALSYAAEWILDNYYVIEQSIRQIREDLPAGYYHQLPLLSEGPHANLPRIYAVALQLTSLPGNALDTEQVQHFIRVYQDVQPLLMSELWALPIMLRISLLQRLTELVEPIALRDTGQLKPGQPPDTPADGIAVGYCITGLRWVAVQDWLDFFESVSLVEHILADEPAGIYPHMDFDTRNTYRKAIEAFSRAANVDEQEVAHQAVELAATHSSNGKAYTRYAHVGYYLVDDGYRLLETHFHYTSPWLKRIQRWLLHHPSFTYTAPVLLVTALALVLVASFIVTSGGTLAQTLVATLLAVVPAFTAVISLVNWIVTQLIPPRKLPRMDFKTGIPAECRTIVAIPILLPQGDELNALAQEFELHYLRNSDPQLSFVLLSDFSDAPQKDMPGDAALLEQAAGVIKALNVKYQAVGRAPFFLLHRERRWNPREGCWMGWERKRGKLVELNSFINGCAGSSFRVIVGDEAALKGARYVITLDADTVVPRDSAARIVATLAHPLNRAEFSPDGTRVVAGYTVLQPRTEILPESVDLSWFTRIFAGDVGLDPYTHAVSDVYQDLFGEGIYVGKGIYDVAAFEKSLHGRVPENALLSHDLFEGIHGRAGLVTDITLLEDYPPHYPAHIMRQHRWMRGDWQLLPWLMPLVPRENGAHEPNTLSWIDRWKIIDNLRRSLVAPALIGLFVLNWLWIPGNTVIWSLAAALSLGMPALTGIISTLYSSLFKRVPGVEFNLNLKPIGYDLLRWLLALVFLPYEALVALDAILTTLTRLLITRRKMLEWTTAARAARSFGDGLSPAVLYRQMILTVIFVLAALCGVAYVHPSAVQGALPWSIIWLLSPEVAFWISRPLREKAESLSTTQRQWLRNLARRTWYYFEHLVGPEDNWLPPDHYQEAPLGVIAHHTSPTNLGMLLLSTMAANDLGYLRRLDMIVRLQATFETMRRLERYRGHFLNWYDTRTLVPLPPAYVSMVDSGNLAACLLALRQGCLNVQSESAMRWERYEGLVDLLELLRETIHAASAANQNIASELDNQLLQMHERIFAVKNNPALWYRTLDELMTQDKPKLDQLLLQFIDSESEGAASSDVNVLGDIRAWTERVVFHLDTLQGEWDSLIPWQRALTRTPALFDQPAFSPAWHEVLSQLPPSVSLGDLASTCHNGREAIKQLRALMTHEDTLTSAGRAAIEWCDEVTSALGVTMVTAIRMLDDFRQLAEEAEGMVQEMDFGFLFNAQREVFHIGYNLTNSRLDQNYYDLLSSEARIGSLVAIAKGDVPVSHWLHLGRPLTRTENQQVMLSWSGTMFEYLMPSLLMRAYPGTLLHQTCNAVVHVQMEYAKRHHVPWGVSESGYYAFDSNQNYQYRAFGVPGLGYKRGLADDLVIAPYASALALNIQPSETVRNLQDMADAHILGRYGFFDAIDYTPVRLPPDRKSAVVQSYLAHHQGMSLLAFVNYLHDDVMINRFHADPRVVSVELLLQEKIPVNAPLELPHASELSPAPMAPSIIISPWEVPTESEWPQAHVISHGGLSTLITSAGAGFSQWQGMQLTRWNADPTLEDSGAWVYIQERRDDHWSPADVWSMTRQPTGVRAEDEHVLFHAHQVAFQRNDRGIATQAEVTVVPDDNVEIRRITLTNHTDAPRHLRLTSYAEVVLAPQATDQRHPAFNKLFIESELLPDLDALIFHRRPRSATEKPVYLLHTLVMPSHQASAFETSRAQFIGRGRDGRHPAALDRQEDWLSGTTGATLDPIMAIGIEVEIPPHEQVQLAYLTLAGNSRKDLIQSARRFKAWPAIGQAFDQSRAQADLDLRRHGFGTSTLAQIEQLLSALLYPNHSWRASAEVLAGNSKGQSGLWSFGISGDYPILLARLSSEGAPIIAELIQAHNYWRDRGITVNLVFLNERDTGYDQSLSNYLYRVLTATGNTNWLNRRDGIFILRSDQLSESDRVLLQTVARAVFDSERGPLADQLQQARSSPARLPQFVAMRPEAATDGSDAPVPMPKDLLYSNDYGGFSADGHEYVIYIPNLADGDIRGHRLPPAPWCNVIANSQFGFLISESGSSCTWSSNSGENRLTPWNNDPVSDRPGEALYLRDEETSAVWSPTPHPAGADAPYLTRYGAGYAIFEHHSHALAQRLRCFTPPDAPVKLMQLELHNTSDQPRRITATYYAEWVLGTTSEGMRSFIVPEFISESQTLLARNAYSAEFGQRVAFVTANQPMHGLTTDRTEFIGRLGSVSAPAALRRIGLAGTVQAGLDPCAAIQIHIDLAPNETRQVHFAIGQGANRDEALQLARQFASADTVQTAWEATLQHWDDLLGTVKVHTPDPALDVMLNRWLLYQALACRIWGRTAFYQSSGAYGYRDQLQDVMSLVHTAPQLTRAHLLEAAQHQFEAGDVLHWWHPPSGRGIRSRCSDDLLWLPYVTAHYIAATGDLGILEAQVPFLKGEPLKPDEEERYALYESTPEHYSLYEHCLRALRKGSTTGPHDLPLIGTGDWNDGFNRVGINGRGESVWLGWFLYATLQKFAVVCERYNDGQQSEEYRKQATTLAKTLDTTAWDGQWYRRAYYDDGTPLGSAQNSECQIDSIAQSWATISGAGAAARAQRAMQSALDLLVRPADQLVLLFTPPLDKTTHDPGYIRGYAPGIRENGGQYTHAAIWLAWAFAALDDGEQAAKLFQMLNPMTHAGTTAQVNQYHVEPYVIAADIYGVAPYVGRGGWTWYTGSASWMYRLGVEEILGIQRSGTHLRLTPHIPGHWPGYEVTYRYGSASYHIVVTNTHSGTNQPQGTLDGQALADGDISLQDDGQTHEVTLRL